VKYGFPAPKKKKNENENKKGSEIQMLSINTGLLRSKVDLMLLEKLVFIAPKRKRMELYF